MDTQDVLNQACNHKRGIYFILDFFVETVGYFNKNDKTIWSYTFFLIRKNIVHVKLQPRM